MVIEDVVYGELEILDPLIVDLIGSTPMQRLKQIGQSGASVFLNPKRDVTRFDHCVGVWHLLNRFGASREEQVAGLLHDTPHTAFSHVFDVVFPNAKNDFHEQFEEKIIRKSEIPNILMKHDIKLEKILHKEKFHLLEADLPDLSVDRIDYFLRDTRGEKLFPDELVNQFLDDLKVQDQKFYFRNEALATAYALLFIDAGRLLWVDPNSHGSYYLLAEAIKRGISLNKLTEEDFFKTDKEVFNILQGIKDNQIRTCIDKLNPQTKFIYCDKESADFYGPNKPRVVDPYVFKNGELQRVSEINLSLVEYFEEFKNRYKNIGVKIK
jgi:uncharacterized protein